MKITKLSKLSKPPVAVEQPRFTISRTGLEIHTKLTLDEWRDLATQFGHSVVSAAFVIGDWLVYGEDHFRGQIRLPGFENEPVKRGRVPTDLYEEALTATNLDKLTLQAYAYVARKVPRLLRNQLLSWEHHKAVAKLKDEEQEEWLSLAARKLESGEPVSSRRLRKSITAGRLLKPEEMVSDPADRGRYNHIPFVNRLCAWFSWLRERRWLDTATPEQRAALKRDLKPLVEIYNQI